ncbi:alpha-L-fucosidase [Agromyces sp. NPDC056965]|uniref:alpha-L-fucosidase n=1 Tax=Agromyces sp. NPDC056965 TaxID=3345983 RepID=UPI003630D80E
MKARPSYSQPKGVMLDLDRHVRTQWFLEDRFGMFIHWGAFSVHARGEWARSWEQLSMQDYQPYVDGFTPDSFDAEAWADIAVAAGMKYAVLTAKHHDGFCLFDTAETSYSTMNNGFGRDVVAEFVEAFRRRGLKVGLYFSLIDWSHPDYPAFDDAHHPHRADPAFEGRSHDFDRYLDFMHAQIRELATNYGQLDLMWFDFSYDDLSGEVWRAAELVEMVRGLQPGILIDNRLEANGGSFGSIVTDEPSAWAGDFVSPEQLIPTDGIRDVRGRLVPWESCITLNNHWSHFGGDDAYKSSRTLIRKLVEIVSKGGNLLLNVGPLPDGRIDPREAQILAEVGSWLTEHGESIYRTGIAGLPKPEWGYYTRRDDTLYAHVLEQPIGPLALTGVDPDRIAALELDGREIQRAESWLIEAYPDVAFVSFGDGDPSFTYPLPDDTDTVVTVRLTAEGAGTR